MRDLSRLVVQLPYSTDGYASLSVPTHRASTIVFRTAEEYAKRGERGPDGYVYGLHGTPTARALQARLTALEGGQRTALLPSGQAAIATVFLAVTAPGDRILIPDTVYPPVRDLAANFLAPRGIECEIYDPELAAESIADRIDRRTRLVWLESPGSTTMEIQDVTAITNAAHAKGALVGCDNTWATPLFFKPLSHGVDLSMQALTKYGGGHSDFLMGSVSVSDVPLYYRLKATMRMLGIGVSPDDCFLALRGLETMGVRLAHCSKVALDLASQLARSPAVERVLHPALSDSPGHAIWKRDFAGSSGVFSAVLRRDVQPVTVAEALAAMRFFSIGASWGGTHSLLVPMEIAKDRTIKRWDPGTMVLRLSIGMEDPEDLREDLHAVTERLERDLSLPG